MPSAERRTVAVLFSDLSGFTALSETMDPEDVRDLVDALFARFRKAIESRGGTVDKFIGDAVMAVFGAPVAHEDDPLRAVRAALEMQREIEAFNRERKLDLRLRIGVNVGEVLWGGVGGDRATAMGDAVNVAQRLEAAARPGAVLVSEAIRAATRGRIRCSDAGELALKGRREAVRVHEVTGEDRSGAESVIVEGIGAPIYGRDADLARLEDLWKRGSGEFHVLEGEAGIGKSRLVAELRQRARGGGAIVLTGRAIPEAPLPLAPFAEIARQGAGPGAEEGARVAAWFASVLGEGPVAMRQADLVALSLGLEIPEVRRGSIDAATARDETTPAWIAWFRALTSTRRVLVCIEDLHWADAATCALAVTLAREAAPGSALVVATTRPGAKLPSCRVLPVADLDLPAIRAVASTVLGGPVSDALADFLLRQSSGNPFFAEELARFLRRTGLVSGNPFALAATPERMPDTLLGVLVARLDALSAGCREALKSASVLGRVFWASFLGGPHVTGAIEEARRENLILPSPGSVLPGEEAFQFRHALLRDAAYSLLTKKDRASLHRAAAEALEPRAASAGRAVLTLAAGHREAAGDRADAARLHRRVATTAAMRNPQESLSAAREAVRLDPCAEALCLLANALFLLARLPESEEAAGAALAHPDALPIERANAALTLCNLDLQRGRFARAFERATSSLDPSLSPAWALNRRTARAQSLFGLGRPAEALLETEDVPARPFPQASDELSRGRLLAERGAILMRLGRFEEALAVHRRVRIIFSVLGIPLGVSTSDNNIAAALMRLRRLDEARAGLEQSLASARALGIRHGVAIVLTNLGALFNRLDRHGEAETMLREALAIREQTGVRQGNWSIRVNLAQSLTGLGRMAEAAAVLEQGCVDAARQADPMPRVRLLLDLASLESDRGQPRAADLAREAESTLEAHPVLAAEPVGLAFRGNARFLLARDATLSGRREEAQLRLDEALEFLRGSEERDIRIAVHLLRARCGVASAPADADAALSLARDLENRAFTACALATLALLEARAGRTPSALARLGEALAAGEQPAGDVERLRLCDLEQQVREALGDRGGAESAGKKARALAEKTGAFGLLSPRTAP